MTQSLTLPAAGLMTDPGPFTAAPDGGLLEAQNVVVMRPGVIEPRPGAYWILDALAKAGGFAAQQVYGSPNDLGYVWLTDGATWLMRRNGSTTITGPTAFTRGKIRVEPTGGRSLFTSDNGVCTLPNQLASPMFGGATATYRAGMPQPYSPRMLTQAASAGYPVAANWLPNGSSVAYRVTLRRRLADETIVESAPSRRVVVTNTSGISHGVLLTDVAGSVFYAWYPGGIIGAQTFQDLIAGDELCVYRSPSVVGVPSDEMTLRAVLTWDPVNGGFVNWFDGLADSEWSGAALYTNETQEGAAYANYRPDYARDIALYNGMTFYAAATSPQRVDLTLKKIGVGSPDPAEAMCSFNSAGNITSGTNTILAATNIRYYSVGQVITTGGDPGTVSAAFPTANTYVTNVNTSTNVVTLSANAGATVVGQPIAMWDWIETSVPGSRIYHIATAAVRTFSDAQTLDNRWNGDLSTSVQLRCTSESLTEDIACAFFQPEPNAAPFSVRSSKPLAWDRLVDSVTGVASDVVGGQAALTWSKTSEPEHVPLPNRTTIGDAAFAIRRIVVARNSLLVFKDDGLFQVFGQTQDSLTFELLDRTITIPSCGASFDEQCKWVARYDDRVAAMTTRGPMLVGDAGGTLIGAPILESLRREFATTFGAQDDVLRAINVELDTQRIWFVWSRPNAQAYVVDMANNVWTYWTWSRPIGAGAIRPKPGGSNPILSSSVIAGGHTLAFPQGSRTMLDDPTLTPATMPSTYDNWFMQTCNVASVTGTGPYTITLTPGSEWTPDVGDWLDQSGTLFEVINVVSPTVFESSGAPALGTSTWREGFPVRVVWLARNEGNVGAEKHWSSVVFPFELYALCNRMTTTFAGYRNTSAPVVSSMEPTVLAPASPWPLIPAFKRVGVPTAFGRDWALKVGFAVQQAGVWFSTAGLSALFEQAAPDRVSRG